MQDNQPRQIYPHSEHSLAGGCAQVKKCNITGRFWYLQRITCLNFSRSVSISDHTRVRKIKQRKSATDGRFPLHRFKLKKV